MNLEPLTFDSALYVAQNMRQLDKAEIYATRWTDDPRDVAKDCAQSGPFSWVAGLERPIAVIGAVPMHPGVWSVYMFATDDFRQISFSLTKFVRRVMIPALVSTGAHRAECRSLADHEVAHRWLESLGAKRQAAVLQGYGRNGEDFLYYVWDRSDVPPLPENSSGQLRGDCAAARS